MGMTALLAAGVLAASPTEVGVYAGGYASGVQTPTELRLEPFSLLYADARVQPLSAGAWRGALLEASLGGLASLSGRAWGEGVGIARAGWAWSSFSVALGAHVRAAPTPSAVQLLPSATMAFRPGVWGLRLGLFDRIDGPIARLAFEYGTFGVAVAPVGVEVYGRLPVSDALAIDLRAFGNGLLDARFAGATAGLVWFLDKEASR
jgi:hypothetical protein